PRGPVDERAGELDVRVRLRERVGHGLVRTDRLAELRARLSVLDAKVECALRDAERFGGGCCTKARRLLYGPERARGINGRRAAAPRQRGNVRQIEAGVAGVSQSPRQQRPFDKAGPGRRDVEPTELHELAPAVILRLPDAVDRKAVGEPRSRRLLQLE